MTEDEALARVTAAAAAINLALAPEHLPGVVHYYRLAAGLAAQFEDFPLPLECEPAPVYEA